MKEKYFKQAFKCKSPVWKRTNISECVVFWHLKFITISATQKRYAYRNTGYRHLNYFCIGVFHKEFSVLQLIAKTVAKTIEEQAKLN